MAPAAAASMPLLALALALALRLEPAQATTACVERGNISFCAALVTYQVADDLNQTEADLNASASAQSDGCPTARRTDYLCRKFFPECRADNTSILVSPVCLSSCEVLFAPRTDCSRFNVTFECDPTSGFFSANASLCFPFAIESSSSSNVIKFVLVGVILAFALALLASYLWHKYKEWSYDPEKDPDRDEVVSKETGVEARRKAERENQGYVGIGGALQPERPVRQDVTLEERERAFRQSAALTEMGQLPQGSRVAPLPAAVGRAAGTSDELKEDWPRR